MTTSTITARRKRDPQHYVEGKMIRLKVWLVTFVALESLNFGAILLLKSSKKVTTSDQGCPRGGQNRSEGVPPRGSEKQIAKTNAPQRERIKQKAPECEPKSYGLVILGNIFRCCSDTFFGCIFFSFRD